VSTTEQFAPDLHEALESALDACRHALADYRAGLLDEAELRRALFRWGLVQWPDSAWLLDLQAGRWWRYDGLALNSANGSELDDPAVPRLRAVIDELTSAGSDQ
jgi:hypothetical protein